MSQPALDKSDRAISEIIRVFNSANEDDITTPNVVREVRKFSIEPFERPNLI